MSEKPVAYRYDYLTRYGTKATICRTEPWPAHKREGWTEQALYTFPTELVEALRRIVDLDHHNMGPPSTSSIIARAALAKWGDAWPGHR